MARREHDLLAVFKAPAAGVTGAKPPRRASKGSGSKFEGVFLAPRQLLLGGCVVVLLLVLGFTVGLGVGRSGAAPAARAPLARQAVSWVLRGKMSAVDFGRGEDLSPARVTRELETRYGVPARMVRVDTGREPVRVTIGPFATLEEAQRFFDARGLAAARLGSAAPFRTTVPEAVR